MSAVVVTVLRVVTPCSGHSGCTVPVALLGIDTWRRFGKSCEYDALTFLKKKTRRKRRKMENFQSCGSDALTLARVVSDGSFCFHSVVSEEDGTAILRNVGNYSLSRRL